jgi:hypothetical protein
MKYALIALRFADVNTETVAEFESVEAVDILSLVAADYNKNVKAEFAVDKSAVSVVENVADLLKVYSSHFMDCGEEVDAEQILEMEMDAVSVYEISEDSDHYVLIKNY